jgi:hypothetical protein
MLEVEPAIHQGRVGTEGVVICGGNEQVVGERVLAGLDGTAGFRDVGGAFYDGKQGVVEITEKTEDRKQKTEDRKQRTEGRGRRTDILFFVLFSQTYKTGEEGEEGCEDAGFENGKIDEVMDEDGEEAAEQGDSGNGSILHGEIFAVR